MIPSTLRAKDNKNFSLQKKAESKSDRHKRYAELVQSYNNAETMPYTTVCTTEYGEATIERS